MVLPGRDDAATARAGLRRGEVLYLKSVALVGRLTASELGVIADLQRGLRYSNLHPNLGLDSNRRTSSGR